MRVRTTGCGCIPVTASNASGMVALELAQQHCLPHAGFGDQQQILHPIAGRLVECLLQGGASTPGAG